MRVDISIRTQWVGIGAKRGRRMVTLRLGFVLVDVISGGLARELDQLATRADTVRQVAAMARQCRRVKQGVN